MAALYGYFRRQAISTGTISFPYDDTIPVAYNIIMTSLFLWRIFLRYYSLCGHYSILWLYSWRHYYGFIIPYTVIIRILVMYIMTSLFSWRRSTCMLITSLFPMETSFCSLTDICMMSHNVIISDVWCISAECWVRTFLAWECSSLEFLALWLRDIRLEELAREMNV